MSLYTLIREAGIPHASHESDLLFKATAEADKFLGMFPQHKANAVKFYDNIDHEFWVAVPFAYDPWWIEKKRKHKVPLTTEEWNELECRPR